MKLTIRILSVSILILFLTGNSYGLEKLSVTAIDNNLSDVNKITATNDTFNFISGCGVLGFGGNVIANDLIPEGITVNINYIVSSGGQLLSFGKDGKFAYLTDVGYNGSLKFSYNISDKNDALNYDEATVIINIKSDYDCDGVFDTQDIDDDNDGIPDEVEGNGDVDSDSDGITDNFDIDDDNDGIPDIREWQTENDYKLPSGIDLNNNGWDDVFEDIAGKSAFITVDTDNDNIPDFLDSDSDNDEITDLIEATDSNNDFVADQIIRHSDFDRDGLDDAFDIVKYWKQDWNSAGSNVPLPDHNANGILDFREKSSLIRDNKIKYDSSLITFPNPTNGLFSIQIKNFSNEQKTTIRIYTMDGEMIKNIIPRQSFVNLDLTYLQSGIYVVKMASPTSECTRKLILQNE